MIPKIGDPAPAHLLPYRGEALREKINPKLRIAQAVWYGSPPHLPVSKRRQFVDISELELPEIFELLLTP